MSRQKTNHSKPPSDKVGNYLDKKRAPWPADAPQGKAWQCPHCPSWATLGGNAGFHRDKKSHGEPFLVALHDTRGTPAPAPSRKGKGRKNIQSAGGHARAAALSKAERQGIAAKAARARWQGKEEHDHHAREKCAICHQPRHRHDQDTRQCPGRKVPTLFLSRSAVPKSKPALVEAFGAALETIAEMQARIHRLNNPHDDTSTHRNTGYTGSQWIENGE